MPSLVKLIKRWGCVGKQIQENKNFLLMTSSHRGQQPTKAALVGKGKLWRFLGELERKLAEFNNKNKIFLLKKTPLKPEKRTSFSQHCTTRASLMGRVLQPVSWRNEHGLSHWRVCFTSFLLCGQHRNVRNVWIILPPPHTTFTHVFYSDAIRVDQEMRLTFLNRTPPPAHLPPPQRTTPTPQEATSLKKLR